MAVQSETEEEKAAKRDGKDEEAAAATRNGAAASDPAVKANGRNNAAAAAAALAEAVVEAASPPSVHKVQFDSHVSRIETEDGGVCVIESVFVSSPAALATAAAAAAAAAGLESAEVRRRSTTSAPNSPEPRSRGRSKQKSPPPLLPGSPARTSNRRRNRTLSDASSNFSLSRSRSSSSSSSSSDSSSSSSYSYSASPAPDGGWGWVIVAASFLINMIADGVTFSFGVIFVELQAEFSESKAVTAGVVSLFHSVPLLSGPIASALTDRYGCRKMTILGSLLATLGFLLSSFCYKFELLYLTFGLISGFGLSLCYVAAIVIVAYYFDRRRSFATGISVCGSGVGTFVFAPLTQYLIEEYGGWRGATVILAGFFLNMCVCGALFRDLEWTRRRRRKWKRTKKMRKTLAETLGSLGSMSNHSSGRQQQYQQQMPEIEELKELLENGDVSTLFAQHQHESKNVHPRVSASLVDIPTYVGTGEALSHEVITAFRKNSHAFGIVSRNYPEMLLPQRQGDGDETGEEEEEGQFLEVPSTGVKLKRKVSSLFKKRPPTAAAAADVDGPRRSILKKPLTNRTADAGDTSVVNIVSSDQEGGGGGGAKPSAARTLNHLRIRRQSLTYRGAMLNISRYRLRASSCPDIYKNSMTTIAQEFAVYDESLVRHCLRGIRDFFRQCCQWNFFTAPFVLFCVSNLILYAWYDVMYVYLVDYSEQDLGVDSVKATYLISFLGFLNMVGEVLIGWAGDRDWTNMNLMYAACMLGCGISTAVVPFLTSYSWLAAMAGIYGFGISANYALTSPILVELVSIEQFSNAYGFLLMVQGISNLVGPPFAGYLYDITLQWYLTFGLAGLFITVSGVILLVLPCLNKMRMNRLSQANKAAAAAAAAAAAKDDHDAAVVTLPPPPTEALDVPKRNSVV